MMEHGRHGAGRAESSTPCSEGKQENIVFQAARRMVSKPTSTSFNKTTSPIALVGSLREMCFVLNVPGSHVIYTVREEIAVLELSGL